MGSVSSTFKIKIEEGYPATVKGTRVQNYSLVANIIPTGPTVSTIIASGISTTGATLNGPLNANGISVVASFDYGKAVEYGMNVSPLPQKPQEQLQLQLQEL